MTPKPFPLRTLLVCATCWMVATQLMIFDYLKFNARAELLEQVSRVLHPSALSEAPPL